MKKIRAGSFLCALLYMAALTFGGLGGTAQAAPPGLFPHGAVPEALEINLPGAEDMFTERDFDPSYTDCARIDLADGASVSDSKAVSVDKDSLTISQEGIYMLSGTLSNGQIVVRAPESAKVQLVLDGADISSRGSAAIYIVSADKVFITSTEGSENSLRSAGPYNSSDIDGTVFAHSDICFNGSGSLAVVSETGHAIATKDDLKICSGSYSISSAKRGLSGKDSIRIGGGTISVDSQGDGLHSEHDSADKGYIFISGGEIQVQAAKDGIDCTNYFNMTGGEVTITAGSDGINAACADDSAPGVTNLVRISGGEMNIIAREDGIDSNGNLSMAGGTLCVSAAPTGGDGALDYELTGEISGGSVVAASAREMAANFNLAASQGSMLCSFSQSHPAGEEIKLKDAQGNVLLSFSPENEYQAVVLSCADIQPSGKYTVSAGSESLEISMEGTLWGNGFGPMGGHGGLEAGENGGLFNFFGKGKKPPAPDIG